jgi:hypothetical protein
MAMTNIKRSTPALDAERRRYVATAPDGTKLQRRTTRAYTHAIIVLSKDGRSWHKIGFAGSIKLAQACAERWDKGNAAYEARRAREAGLTTESPPVRRSVIVPAVLDVDDQTRLR